MPEIQIQLSITTIIALCALVSPIATAIINNRHLYRMKQLEYRHEAETEERKREREIYEGYIRAAGACAQSPVPDNLSEFGRFSAVAQYFVSDEVRGDMLELEKMIFASSHDRKMEKINHIAQIITKLRALRMTELSGRKSRKHRHRKASRCPGRSAS